MKAGTVAARSSGSQMEGSRAVAETPTQQKFDGRRVNNGRRRGDEFRSSTVPNVSDERVVAVTQESLDGVREKALRIASLDEMGASSSAKRWL